MYVNFYFYFLSFFLCLLPPILFFCMRLVFFFLPPSISKPACRCHQTTWRLTVICSRFPKPTIWDKKKLTGLRSPAPALDTTAAATQLGGPGTVSNTPTMITTSLLRRTCGPKMSMATEVDTLRPVTIVNMAALADTHPGHVNQMSRGPQGHLKGTQKTRRCAKTLQYDPHLQDGVESQGQEGTILRTTPETQLGPTMDNAPQDRGTRTVPHAANPSRQGTCRVNQVNTGHLYTCNTIKKHAS